MANVAARSGVLVLVLLAPPGCDDGESMGQTSGESGDESGESGESGQPAPLDSDEDGLSDDEEAELGTDPLDKDSDDDNYWDSWELIEGTDPLDKDSRIYRGWWPYNPDKDALPQATWANASTTVGAQFPRDRFVDRHGDLVDLYDFANFTINPTGEPAYIIVDISAQWCGPCHNMAFWLGGGVSQDTTYFMTNFPSVPQKVHDLQVWWMTFIVEGGDGNAPDAGDPQVWFSVHPDNYIPVFADVDQNVRANFSGGFYPFTFLLDPQLAIAHWDENAPNYPLLFAEQL